MSASDKQKLTKWTELLHYVGNTVASGGAQCSHDHGDSARPDGDLDRRQHHEDRERLHEISRC